VHVDFFNVGKIINTHGIKGELKVMVTSDFPERRFRVGNSLTLFSPDERLRKTITVQSTRWHKNMLLLTCAEMDTMSEAEQYKQWTVKVERAQLQPLADGEYYFHEIIGCAVITDTGQSLGTVRSILTPGANHVWVVQLSDTKKELLLPVIDDVVLHVDTTNKKILVHLLEGLM
jgi:16S rRNA processing protein RimM